MSKDQLLGSCSVMRGKDVWLSSNKSPPWYSLGRNENKFFYSSQKEVPRPESLASPENLLDMHTLSPQTTKSNKLWGWGPVISTFQALLKLTCLKATNLPAPLSARWSLVIIVRDKGHVCSGICHSPCSGLWLGDYWPFVLSKWYTAE